MGLLPTAPLLHFHPPTHTPAAGGLHTPDGQTDVRRSQPIPAPDPEKRAGAEAGPARRSCTASLARDAFCPSAGAVARSPAATTMAAAMDYRAVAMSQAVPGQFDDAEGSDG